MLPEGSADGSRSVIAWGFGQRDDHHPALVVLASMVGEQQLWRYAPTLGGKPSLRGQRQTVVGPGNEVSDEDGSVAAQCAGNVDHRRLRLTPAAVVAGDDFALRGRIGMQPGHGEVGTLVRRLGAGGRVVPTGRRRPCRHVDRVAGSPAPIGSTIALLAASSCAAVGLACLSRCP